MLSQVQTAQGPAVVAVDMGYGHLRAATPLAEQLGSEVLHVDRPPIVAAEEERLWRRVRSAYETVSRLSQIPVVGAPLRYLLDWTTNIPRLHPYRDLSAPTSGVLTLERLIRRNLGQGLVHYLRETGAPLLTTFYSPAIVADRAGLDRIFCVVTDTDLNRVWAPVQPRETRIRYLVPTRRAARRLQAYGVPPERITFTGFPLPDSLVGGPSLSTLKRNLAARIVRLDPSAEFRRSMPEELFALPRLAAARGGGQARPAHLRGGRRGRPGRHGGRVPAGLPPRAGVRPSAHRPGGRRPARGRGAVPRGHPRRAHGPAPGERDRNPQRPHLRRVLRPLQRAPGTDRRPLDQALRAGASTPRWGCRSSWPSPSASTSATTSAGCARTARA